MMITDIIICVVFSLYNIYYAGEFLLWRSTTPGITAEVWLQIIQFLYFCTIPIKVKSFAKIMNSSLYGLSQI